MNLWIRSPVLKDLYHKEYHSYRFSLVLNLPLFFIHPYVLCGKPTTGDYIRLKPIKNRTTSLVLVGGNQMHSEQEILGISTYLRPPTAGRWPSRLWEPRCPVTLELLHRPVSAIVTDDLTYHPQTLVSSFNLKMNTNRMNSQ